MSANNEKISSDTLVPVAASLAAVAAKEIETLKQTLQEKESHILVMEQVCLSESEHQAELEDSIIAWQDKYDRLYESHKRVQKVNQGLEDKLLKLVDRNSGERAQLTSDVATLSVRLAQANFNISKLQKEIERYKTDINLAIQLLQCKPDSFVPQKVSSLPIDIQSKVSSYMRLDTNSHSDSEGSITGVGVSTTTAYKVLPATDSPPRDHCPFPPTAMVYSMRGLDANLNSESSLNLAKNNANNNNNNNSLTSDAINNNSDITASASAARNSTNSLNASQINGVTINDNDMISPVVMAKFLQEELKAGEVKHCDTCQCSKDLTVLADVSHSYSVATQTPFMSTTNNASSNNLNDSGAQLCLRCYSNLNSPSRTNSPYTKNLLKSSDSVISETKSSVSDLNEMEKLFTPIKKDDLMVNPILGHHRLCERSYTQKNGGIAPTAPIKLSYSTLLENMKSGSNYQRRFVDGGGTALNLLEEKAKLSILQKSKQVAEDINGNNDLLDEEKPLLDPSLGENIPVDSAEDSLHVKAKLRTESSCELRRAITREPIKSPTASTKSALEPSKASIDGLVKTAMTGSVTSVWSKTSSCEGARMFENFNRNLIKTIKAENPKNRGPRLCAMRIQQNGQSNILLDNIESIEAITPIIYRRRERLLDEELDDGKDIITSKTTLSNVPQQQQETAIETAKEAVEIEDPQTGLTNSNGDNNCSIQGGEMAATASGDGKRLQAPDELLLFATEEKTDNLLGDKKIETNTGVTLPPVTCDNSCKNSAGTQSSSLNDNIDFQETVILRRQQLSRVAEWVQNNTQQMEREQQQHHLQHIEKLNHCASSATDHQSSSFSTLDQLDSVSVEKMSLDSGYKTTPQFQPVANSSQDDTIKTSDESLSPKSELNNEIPIQFSLQASNTASIRPDSPEGGGDSSANAHSYSTPKTYYRRTSRSGLPVAYTTPDPQDSSSQCSQIIPEQPTCDIVNYKYYPSDSDKTRTLQPELHAANQHVDIAQMEYNVKQFLLKQNEWSMKTTASNQVPTTAPPPQPTSASASFNRHATIRPITLFSSTSGMGFGPGKGERVLCLPSTSTSTTTTAGNTSKNISTSTSIVSGMRQRTETNL
uniref:Tight junction-associated protein 1 domain-containing protein n=1 Tax=Stomoxys calcitrans TaxID=35570 RepID=A0A1I8P3C5_STOCA